MSLELINVHSVSEAAGERIVLRVSRGPADRLLRWVFTSTSAWVEVLKLCMLLHVRKLCKSLVASFDPKHRGAVREESRGLQAGSCTAYPHLTVHTI